MLRKPYSNYKDTDLVGDVMPEDRRRSMRAASFMVYVDAKLVSTHHFDEHETDNETVNKAVAAGIVFG